MNEFFIKKIDQLPVLQSQLEDYYGVIDLSSASAVKFVYKSRMGGNPVTGSATIYSASSGIVQYAWTSGDVANAGVFYGEWRVAFTGGKQMSFPNNGYISFEIIDNLDTF